LHCTHEPATDARHIQRPSDVPRCLSVTPPIPSWRLPPIRAALADSEPPPPPMDEDEDGWFDAPPPLPRELPPDDVWDTWEGGDPGVDMMIEEEPGSQGGSRGRHMAPPSLPPGFHAQRGSEEGDGGDGGFDTAWPQQPLPRWGTSPEEMHRQTALMLQGMLPMVAGQGVGGPINVMEEGSGGMPLPWLAGGEGEMMMGVGMGIGRAVGTPPMPGGFVMPSIFMPDVSGGPPPGFSAPGPRPSPRQPQPPTQPQPQPLPHRQQQQPHFHPRPPPRPPGWPPS
jgi:hypothetical protein